MEMTTHCCRDEGTYPDDQSMAGKEQEGGQIGTNNRGRPLELGEAQNGGSRVVEDVEESWVRKWRLA
jgi:hypothetical protein